MKTHTFKLEIILWYIKVSLTDKEIGAQLTNQDLHGMFNMTSIL